jgi:hypothetical protein
MADQSFSSFGERRAKSRTTLTMCRASSGVTQPTKAKVILRDRLQKMIKSEEYGLKSYMAGLNMKNNISGRSLFLT